jgi:hypothetical protein
VSMLSWCREFQRLSLPPSSGIEVMSVFFPYNLPNSIIWKHNLVALTAKGLNFD